MYVCMYIYVYACKYELDSRDMTASLLRNV